MKSIAPMSIIAGGVGYNRPDSAWTAPFCVVPNPIEMVKARDGA